MRPLPSTPTGRCPPTPRPAPSPAGSTRRCASCRWCACTATSTPPCWPRTTAVRRPGRAARRARPLPARMLVSQGAELAELGVGSAAAAARSRPTRAEIWRRFCAGLAPVPRDAHAVLARARARRGLRRDGAARGRTPPTRSTTRSPSSSPSPDFRPRALFDRFGIEVLATTDSRLRARSTARPPAEQGWGEKVVPTFRPDALLHLDRPDWRADVERLGRARRHRHRRLRRLPGRAARAPGRVRRRRRAGHRPRPPQRRHHPAARRADARPRIYAAGAAPGAPTTARPPRSPAHMLFEMAAMSCDGRPGDAAAPRRAARPRPGRRTPLRPGQGLRHPGRHRVHPRPAPAAGGLRPRPPASG